MENFTKDELDKVRDIIDSHTTVEALTEINANCWKILDDPKIKWKYKLEVMEVMEMLDKRKKELLKDNK